MEKFDELYDRMKDEMPYSCPMHMKPYVKQLAEIYAKHGMEKFKTKINSTILCLLAHPDNEPDSEFADRISDLEEILNDLNK